MKKWLKKIYGALLAPFERKRPAEPAVVLPNDRFFPIVIDELNRGKRVTIQVKGFSMLPTIRGMRDTVQLEKRAQYAPMDIVLFQDKGRYVMHRILLVEPERIVIQGDGVVRGREVVRPEAIFGKAVRIFRDGREDRAVDPDAPEELRRARRWHSRPLWYRRIRIYLYRFAPWNYIWLRHQ